MKFRYCYSFIFAFLAVADGDEDFLQRGFWWHQCQRAASPVCECLVFFHFLWHLLYAEDSHILLNYYDYPLKKTPLYESENISHLYIFFFFFVCAYPF